MDHPRQFWKKNLLITSYSSEMRIGINTRSLIGQKLEGFGNYTLELVQRITKLNPEHTFILYFDRTVDAQFNFGPNVVCKVVSPPTRHPFLYIIWFEWSLKRQIKKDHLDIFWSPDGMFPIGLTIPTLSTIHDLNFEHYPKDLPFWISWYYRKYFPVFASKASHIITVSNTTKADIISQYNVIESKITVIYNGINASYKPLDSRQKIQICEQQGLVKPYFLFVGSLHPRKNIHRLLEAFSIYAKSDDTFDLVIVGSTMWRGQAIEIDPNCADRIHLKGHLSRDILAKIMGAASAFVYVPYFEGFGMPLAEAMATHTPIIAGNQSCLPEIAADAALYVDPFDVDSIVKGMNKMKNDVALQAQLVNAGKVRMADFNWDQAAYKIWQEIEKLVS
jgi:glycosyltransferase involved in cell wall biosynthesis